MVRLTPAPTHLLTKKDRQSILDSFNKADKDKDGLLTLEEGKKAFTGKPFFTSKTKLGQEDIDLVFTRIDTDADGQLTIDECMRGVALLKDLASTGSRKFISALVENDLRRRSSIAEMEERGYLMSPTRVSPSIQGALKQLEFFKAAHGVENSLDTRDSREALEERRIVRAPDADKGEESLKTRRETLQLSILHRPSLQEMVEKHLLLNPDIYSPRIQSSLKALEMFKTKQRMEGRVKRIKSRAEMEDAGMLSPSTPKIDERRASLGEALTRRPSIVEVVKRGLIDEGEAADMVEHDDSWKHNPVLERTAAKSIQAAAAVDEGLGELDANVNALKTSIHALAAKMGVPVSLPGDSTGPARSANGEATVPNGPPAHAHIEVDKDTVVGIMQRASILPPGMSLSSPSKASPKASPKSNASPKNASPRSKTPSRTATTRQSPRSPVGSNEERRGRREPSTGPGYLKSTKTTTLRSREASPSPSRNSERPQWRNY